MFIRDPFAAPVLYEPAYSATVAYTIASNKTMIVPDTLTGAMTINLTLPDGLSAGDEVTVICTADGTDRTVTFGTGFVAGTSDLVVTATTTKTATFIYTGTAFTEKAEPTGIDSVAVGLNTAHRGSDGKNHSDVVLNNTHRTSNRTDHANVGLTNLS